NGRAQVYETATGKPAGPAVPYHHRGRGSRASLSPDGRWLACPQFDETIHVYDREKGQLVTEPLTHSTGHARRAAFSPDGKRLMTSGSADDGGPVVVRLWDTASWRPVGTPLDSGVLTENYSKDGSCAVVGAGSRALVIDTTAGRVIACPLTHDNHVWHASLS